MSGRDYVRGGFCPGGFCPGGFCPGGFLSVYRKLAGGVPVKSNLRIFAFIKSIFSGCLLSLYVTSSRMFVSLGVYIYIADGL